MTRTAIFLWAATSLGHAAGVTITAVGDILPWHWPIEQRAYAFNRADEVKYPWEKIRGELEGVVFGNLEGPLTDGPVVKFKDKNEPSYFAVPSRYAPGLSYAGFDILSVANNHFRDAGDQGVADTLRHLDSQGIFAVGAVPTSPVIFEENGVKLGFLAFNQTLPRSVWKSTSHANADQMLKFVEELKPRVDHVIVSLHWGPEYRDDHVVKPPSKERQTLARLLIRSGARLILGHHSHTVERVESYKNGLIFYGLGNFMFGASNREGHRHGMLAKVYLDKKGIRGKKIIPVLISPKKTKYQPRVLKGEAAKKVLKRWKNL